MCDTITERGCHYDDNHHVSRWHMISGVDIPGQPECSVAGPRIRKWFWSFLEVLSFAIRPLLPAALHSIRRFDKISRISMDGYLSAMSSPTLSFIPAPLITVRNRWSVAWESRGWVRILTDSPKCINQSSFFKIVDWLLCRNIGHDADKHLPRFDSDIFSNNDYVGSCSEDIAALVTIWMDKMFHSP